MAIIALEGMQFYAYHGFYEEEQKIGNHFIVDITVDARVNQAAKKDDLTRTVNYETIYTICRIEMRKPSALLENVVQRIMDKIADQFDHVKTVKVRISKQQPPLGGRVERAYVEMQRGGMVDFGEEEDMKGLGNLKNLGNLKDLGDFKDFDDLF